MATSSSLIDKIHSEFKGELLSLPKPKVQGLNFSFSGLKTATRFLIEKGYPKEQIAASFQETAITYLIDKVKLAIKTTGIKTLSVSGGVSANSFLRKLLNQIENVEVIVPDIEYTSDNGAMVAFTGYRKFLLEGADELSLNAFARKSL
jgi:N6-L-threonylcarbamoyladenine synthase